MPCLITEPYRELNWKMSYLIKENNNFYLIIFLVYIYKTYLIKHPHFIMHAMTVIVELCDVCISGKGLFWKLTEAVAKQ